MPHEICHLAHLLLPDAAERFAPPLLSLADSGIGVNGYINATRRHRLSSFPTPGKWRAEQSSLHDLDQFGLPLMDWFAAQSSGTEAVYKIYAESSRTRLPSTELSPNLIASPNRS
jgi:hypothetical protein